MPGPFPGMDPYLESPNLWPSVHHRLATYCGDSLNELLPDDVATPGERVYVVEAGRGIYPDILVTHRHSIPAPRSGQSALMEACDPPELLTILPGEIHEPFVEIRATTQPERVVTVIELLSHTNKTPGLKGYGLYQQKQAEILGSEVHLLEIDLLRSGEHMVAAPKAELQQMGSWDYLVCLHRSDHRYDYECWRIGLRQRLPRVPVPLLPGTNDVILDLQAMLDRTYDVGIYHRRINYRQEPVAPLSHDDAAWADALLREKRLRS